MKAEVFHSLPEALTYFLLIIVLVVSVAGDFSVYSVLQRHSTLLEQDKADTVEIEQQQKCIAAFFLLPNRTGLTLSNLGVCADVVNGIDHTELK